MFTSVWLRKWIIMAYNNNSILSVQRTRSGSSLFSSADVILPDKNSVVGRFALVASHYHLLVAISVPIRWNCLQIGGGKKSWLSMRQMPNRPNSSDFILLKEDQSNEPYWPPSDSQSTEDDLLDI